LLGHPQQYGGHTPGTPWLGFLPGEAPLPEAPGPSTSAPKTWNWAVRWTRAAADWLRHRLLRLRNGGWINSDRDVESLAKIFTNVLRGRHRNSQAFDAEPEFAGPAVNVATQTEVSFSPKWRSAYDYEVK
jgi:hypothetical protein